ncbi:cytosol aminopeptidase-like [Cimex lectularius]|uniref:Cytosol aminopeptidase n=1 Tax=Cimex lectularius TaxID=79782 RepID=A0A8I6TD74_CIMLE|nr:cytosol aminopeptidase-like [Cimex lectularius]
MNTIKNIRSTLSNKGNLNLAWFGYQDSKRNLTQQSGENYDVRVNCSNTTSVPTGLIIGVYSEEGDLKGQTADFTPAGKKFNDSVKGFVKDQLLRTLPLPKLGQVRLFYGVDDRFNAVAVVGLGTDCIGYNPVEEIDEQKEVIRVAAAVGARALQDLQIYRIMVESFGHAESAAEGATMGLWVYQEHRAEKKQLVVPKLILFDSEDWIGWQIGQQKANAQNLARQFSETPANLLTPSVFAQSSVEVLTKAGVNVEVKVQNWAKLRGFNAFLSVGSGSCQPPIFLEAYYEGCDPDVSPVVLIGKGVTFDAGGVCLHRCFDLRDLRGDMAGAASVVAALRAISTLQLPINVRGLIPLCENMPGASAYKPGDIIRAQNGKTILVQTTANEGRLILADALSYCAVYNPKFVVDIGTLTTEVKKLMGASAAGVFTNSDQLYDLLRIASIHTGDRVWRLPLWEYFTEDVTNTEKSDVQNVGTPDHGGACNAAAFLKEFVPNLTDWVHIDTYGIVKADLQSPPYLRPGMSGRPTRTIIEFLSQLACRN